MENSYGIGIGNRFELFYVDEEAGNPTNKIIKKAKQQKKLAAAASTNVAANGGSGEKENKSAVLNKNSTAPTTKVNSAKTGKSSAPAQNGQQTNRNNTNERAPREGKERKNELNTTQQNGSGENREQRYNRKNRENRENQPFNSHDNNSTNARGDARRQGGNFGNDRGPPQRRQYGKREFDRQSGSDKTGVKAVDKREGGGAHNWGTHKQDIDDFTKGNAEWDAERAAKNKDEKSNDDSTNAETGTDQNTGKENANEQGNQAAEEEAKEITLDEWKAQRAERAKPQYNLRKAGEGEDTSQWKKMVALNNRKKKTDENSEEEYEYDPSMYPQRVGRQKHVLDIDIHFNDGPRGGLNRRRGRPRTQRTWNGPNNGAPADGSNGNATADTEQSGGYTPNNSGPTGNTDRRRNNQQSYRNRNDRGPRRDFYDERRGQNAPKVDDEHDFPSLG